MSFSNESMSAGDSPVGAIMQMEPIEGKSAEVEGIDNKKAGTAWHKMDALVKNLDVRIQGNRNVFYCIKDFVSVHYGEEIDEGLLPEPKPHYAVSLEREGYFRTSFNLIKEKKGKFKVIDVGDNMQALNPLAAGEINAFLDEIANGVSLKESDEAGKVIKKTQEKVENIYEGEHIKKDSLIDYATGDLSSEKASRVKDHIDDCDECKESFEAALDGLAALRGWEEGTSYTPHHE